MPRVFFWLVIGNLIVLVATASLGIVQERANADVHVALAVFSLLVSCFVQVVAFMYVNVTSKAITQAVHLGKLDTSPLSGLRRTKRSMFHALAMAVVGVVAVTATGAMHWQSGDLLIWHWAAAGVLLLSHSAAFFREYGLIVEHSAQVSQVMSAYGEYADRRRAASAAK